MQCTLAFDVYGTLFDPQGIERAVAAFAPERATEVAAMWRRKQLEYAFRRGLMQRFKDFSVCTRDALRYCDELFGLKLTDTDEAVLMEAYNLLPLFDDVQQALQMLGKQHRIYAFSNGCKPMVESLLENAGIANEFNGVVSVSDVKSFKPDPKVYTHFLREANSHPEQTWLVSANGFDIIGAGSVGMRTAWVKRDPAAAFDPWGAQPELVVESLIRLPNQLPVR
ncbi:haloacid dehalogenase type II [Aliidiomarina sedimenti]|uniref:(S)-2-haloacid dehalogenase n=1 Tax=Aliidiomarina sedimenti TaxID=1933879 RepID=A0ABY0BVG6_9GAMM|nr:haloacid dehalogenase type II [Aliidiomarina sedimenti]RUO28110.1 haloacid dehalogenase type II [Aliidiomarina sedimenti]